SRVQDQAAPDTLVITSAAHDLVAGLFEVEDRGETPLKGAPAPVRLYRVVSASDAARPTRGGGRGPTPFVGREEERQRRMGRWRRVRDGEGQFVLLVGEPGIGKSRLMEEFRARIGEEGAFTLAQAAAAPFYANTPFYAVTQMLDRVLGEAEGEGPQARFGRLE